MGDLKKNLSVLCLTGGRHLNKRMVLFIEGLIVRGDAVRVAALPRGGWRLDKSERLLKPISTGRFVMDLGAPSGSRPDVILCFHWAMLPIAVVLGCLFRARVLYDEHDHYELNTAEGSGSSLRQQISVLMVRIIHQCCLPWASVVTCIHMHQSILKRHLEKWQPNVLEIHNYPCRVWRSASRPSLRNATTCFVYIGGVFSEKGPGAAAEALSLLTDELRECAELHIFGEGDNSLIERLRKMPGVFVHRSVTPAEFRAFAADRRCCGLSLLADTPRYRLVGTNCTKLYEYLALGMPVIATDVGEFPQFIEASDVGLIVSGTLDVRQLSAAMSTLLLTPRMFEKMSHQARRLMSQEEMSWEHEWMKVESSGVLTPRKRAA